MQPLRNALCSLVLTVTIPAFAENTTPKPPPPTQDVPELGTVDSIIYCGYCDQPFDLSTHKAVLEDLVSNLYIAELRKALYHQDFLHQFESKAHYDNCDFDSATAYIDILLDEVDEQVREAQDFKDRGDRAGLEQHIRKAFFTLGQALHGVQDFYAHTNYIELSVDNAKRSTDIAIIAPWRQSGKDGIDKLREEGLVSGYVFWGLPQKCPGGTLSHGKLAKDKATTESGKIKVPHLNNRNYY